MIVIVALIFFPKGYLFSFQACIFVEFCMWGVVVKSVQEIEVLIFIFLDISIVGGKERGGGNLTPKRLC